MENTNHKLTWKIAKILWIIVIAIFSLLAVALCTAPKNKKENATLEKKTLPENATTQEKVEFYATLSKPHSDLKTFKINNDILHLYLKASTISEDFILKTAASDHAFIFKNIFENIPEINSIVFWYETEFVDIKGNESTETAFRMTFSRENAKNINYENYKVKCTLDYNNMLIVADNYYIHPAIKKNLKNFNLK